MPRVVIASSLTRWLTPDPTPGASERSVVVTGDTLHAVLEDLFHQFPTLRNYVLDEHGTMRHHVVAFVNGVAIRDKHSLRDVVPPDGEVYIFQALSGG